MSRLLRTVFIALAGTGVAYALGRMLADLAEESRRHARRRGGRQDADELTPEPDPEPATDAPEAGDTVDEAPEPPRAVPDAPAAPEPEEIDGVTIADPAAALAFTNSADADALKEAGLARQAVRAILAGRPYETLAEVAATSGVGPRSLEALAGRG